MHPEDRARRIPGCRPESRTMMEAREEAGMVLFQVVGEALARTGLKPKDIDILVVNCSLFNPTPSLSAMVVNHFKFRSDTVTYNLAGMGCSAGVIAVGLAQKLLRVHGKGAYALVVSTENITQNWYLGDDRSMLIPNTLFRMGGAAVVLTNKASERPRAKYELQHCVRVHLGGDDVAYECVFQHEDASGIVGVELNRDLVKVAGRALERNLTKMAPLVLPVSEMVKYAAVAAARALLPRHRAPPPYTPDFKKAFDHFCLHAGGRGVIDGLAKQLALPAHKAAPSYNSLFWYGNTSSASLWYALGYVEAVQGVRAGEVVWQVGFGSGFKCNSAVWRALRPIHDTEHSAWTHMADESNATAVERHQAAEEAVSQGPGAPHCAGPYLRGYDTGAATRQQGDLPPLKKGVGAGNGGANVTAVASPGRRATRSRAGSRA
jgi:3-ketoacyl-CoA synthase